jgi:cupin 2 domain-containing protein
MFLSQDCSVPNIYNNIPSQLPEEVFSNLLSTGTIRIERILSKGQTSPETGWYDQHEHEWVIVLQGAGELTFANGDVVSLKPGDYLNIPAHTRHRVSWTDPIQVTVWLAVFYT